MTQSAIGAFATVFAYILYYDYFNTQTTLHVPQQDVVLYMSVLIIFGLLSIVSGMFLLNGK